MSVDVKIVACDASGRRVVGYVVKLIDEVGQIAEAVFVIARMPDFFLCMRARGKGVTTLDELRAFCERCVGRSYEEMDMVRHDRETMQQEFSLISVTPERLQEEVGVNYFAEVRMLEER